MSASAESVSSSTARSPIETMPTGRPPSVTSRRRMSCSRISSAAASTFWSASTPITPRVATSRTFVVSAAPPSAIARTTMSRSVRIPNGESPSRMSTGPTSPSRISRAASASVVSGPTVRRS
jgi:hypothetical protein